MDNAYVVPELKKEENVVAGIVGALLFSLVGGILWYVLYQIGFLAGISGIVGVVCALKGYALFAKQESKKGVVISVIAAVLVMVVAWYLCLAGDVYNAYQEWYANGEVDYAPTYFESVRSAYLFLSEPDIALGYIKDLVIGLALCAVGCFKNVVAAFRGVGAKEQPTPMPMPEMVTEPVAEPTEPLTPVEEADVQVAEEEPVQDESAVEETTV